MVRNRMSRVFLFSALVVSAFLRQALAATPITVLVKDQNNNAIPSVYVMAVEFSGDGVGTNTKVGWTSSTGTVVLTVSDYRDYHIFATTQAYGPTLREQVFNPTHPRRWANGRAETVDMRLSSGLTNKALARISLTGGSLNGLTCEGFNRDGSDEELAMSVTQLDGNGEGIAYLFNIPADATSRTYEIGSFDTGSNKSLSVDTTTVITSGAIYDFSVNFNDQNALPPDKVEAQVDDSASSSGGAGGTFSASIEGVVISTFNNPSTGQPYFIPHIGIELRSMQVVNGSTQTFGAGWSNSDQNGRFKFFNLTAGTTYFVRTFSGCTFGGASVCFKGYESPAFSTGGVGGKNDFLYAGGTQIKKLQLEAAPAGTGKIEILVQDEKGRPIPGAWVNVWPDGGPWHYGGPNFQTDFNAPFGPGNEENQTNICTGSGDPFQSFHHLNQVDRNDAGLSNSNNQTTGYTLLSTLLPGNYQIQVWTRFNNNGIMYNAGADGLWDWNWGHRGCGPNTGQQSGQGGGGGGAGPANSVDDMRITISTNTNARGTNVFIYTTSGTLKHADGSADGAYDDYSNSVNITSVVVVVKAKPKPAGARLIQGTLTFPQVVDLSAEPITLIAQRQCTGNDPNCWQDGGFAVIDGSGAASFNYSILVGTASSKYWMNVESGFWGVVREGGGNEDIDLTNISTATKNFKFARAGKLTGNVYKPDGSKFIPGQTSNGYLSGNVNVSGEGSWGWGQVQNDGSYTIGGLLPGTFQLDFQSWGDSGATSGSNIGMPEPRPEASIVAQQITNADIKTVNNEVVLVDVDTSTFAPLKSVLQPYGYRGERWVIMRVGAGRVMNGASMTDLLSGHGNWRTEFNLTIVSNSGNCGPITQADRDSGGLRWCPQKLPTGGTYDFYLMRRGEMDSNDTNEVTYEYLTIVTSSKNVTVNSASTSLPLIKYQSPTPSVKPVRVNMQPPTAPTQGVVLVGTVTAANMFREADFKQLGGEFDNFMRFIPIVSVYDSTGTFLAAGMVTPPPSVVGGDHNAMNCVPGVGPYPKLDFNRNCADDVDEAIVSGNWNTFSNVFNILTSSFGWQYEIRGLPAGKKVNLVITTPNYPAYTEQLTFGVNGSTTIQHFNLDTLVGSGATIQGTVTSTQTSNNAIANATVVIEANGMEKKKFVTDSSGTYKFEGLPPNAVFKISVSAGGYVSAVKNQTASAAASYTVNFALRTAGRGVITGTVYSQRIPFARTQPSASIIAYNDTFNRNNPTEPLPLIKTVTSSTGVYTLTGLSVGDDYKIFLVVPGKYVLSITTTAIDGIAANVDFDMLTRPMEIDVFTKRVGNSFEFRIKNPKDYAEGDVWIGEKPFVKAASVNVGNRFIDLPNNELLLTYPGTGLEVLLTSVTYVLHIEATNLAGKQVVEELEFGLGNTGKADLPVDVQILGDDTEDSSTGRKNNQTTIGQESSGDQSGISFPAGAAIATSTDAVPSLTLTAISSSASAGAGAASMGATAMAKLTSLKGNFMGNIYDVTVSSMNFTGKPVTLTLKYDKNSVTDGQVAALKIAAYDPATDTWTPLSGTITPDKEEGTLSISIDPTSSSSGFYVQNGRYGAQSLASAKTMNAVKTDRGYQARGPMALSAGSGSYAVVSFTSSTVAADGYKQYNFPNPFNLKSKTVNLRSGATGIATTINGTYIVVAPTGSGTVNVKVRIYNLAADLVQEINGTAVAGVYNYFNWDGKNKSGEEVASGVYFATVDAPGSDKKKPIKMVVVK